MAMDNELEWMFDPKSSTLAFFGAELRLRREAAGLTQTALARKVLCAPSLLSKIESAKRVPTDDLAARCDEALGTDGYFSRLWPVVIRHAFPVWFRPWVDMEQQAARIQAFELTLVPGLLQTEDYARAVLRSGRPDNLEERVLSRMHRQHIFADAYRPRFWAIVEEGALRRCVGGPAVMHGQLARLLEAGEDPRTVIQVLPSRVGCHPGLRGAFWTMGFEEGPDVLYLEGFSQGQLRGEPEVLEESHRAYELLRAAALSPEASAGLIARIMKDFAR
ncbi:helix-turn-helix transcriptional regulator [Streptomyces capparidis]